MKVLNKLDSLDNINDGETRKLITKTSSSGSGNVVSSINVSGDTIAYTKDVTALTAHQNAFSNVKVGSTTVAADSAGDTLELVAGSNVTLTPDATNDKVTIAASQPTVNNGTLTIQKNGTNVTTFTANQSSNATANITVPTKTSDLTNDSNFLVNSSSYVNIHPENNPVLIPFINNDIAFLLKRGGSAKVLYDDVEQALDISNVFDGSGSYWAIDPTGTTTIVIELTLHKTFTWTNTIYCDFGASGWRSKSVKIEVMNTNYSGDTWTQKYNTTTNASGNVKTQFTHTPVGADNAGKGFNKIRFTFSDWNSATIFRLAQLGVYNFGSQGVRETYMSRGIDDAIYRNITPNNNNTFNLGSSSNKWANVYATNLNGNATSATKATGDKNGDDITTTYYKASNPNGYTSNTGTITKVQANGTDVASSGTANIPAASTSAYGVTKLSDATNSTSTTLAATPSAVKAAFDNASNKLEKTYTNGTVEGHAEWVNQEGDDTFAIDIYNSNSENYAFTTYIPGYIEMGVNGVSLNLSPESFSLSTTFNSDTSTLHGIFMNSVNQQLRITDVRTPTDDCDAANKKYVDDKVAATTDTKNTAGSTDTSSKIFLIGATSQAANPQTYSDNEVYTTSGVLTTKSVQVGGTAATMQYNSTDKCIEFVFA